MNPIRIDFAPRSLGREIAAMGPMSLLFAGAGIALCMGSAVALLDLTQQQDARQAESKRLQEQKAAERSAHIATARESPISEAQAIGVNGAIAQLNLPWSALLDAIERATPSTVALLELEPDAKKHLVKGVAEARSADVMFNYIRRLKQQPFFGNVVLTRHAANDEAATQANSGANSGTNSEADRQASSRPLRFEFEAEWRQAAP